MRSLAPKPRSNDHFVWSVENRPVSVHLNLEVVRKLELLLHSRLAPGERPDEIGGLLLGYVAEDAAGDFIVRVEAFEVVDIRHVRGSSWILGKQDKQELERQLRRRARSEPDGANIVGWFRTHTRPGLFLDQHDFELFSSFFSHRAMVALVVRPEAEGPATAGFFIWEDGDISRATTYNAFPFAIESLAPAGVAPEAKPQPRTARAERPSKALIRFPSQAMVKKVTGLAIPSKPTPAIARPGTLTRAKALWLGIRPTSNRRVWLWTPVVAGLLLGFLWHPEPFRRRSVRMAGDEALNTDRQRPVFGSALPRPSQVPLEPVTDAESTAPPAIVQTRARQAKTTPRKFDTRSISIASSTPSPVLASAPAPVIPPVAREAVPTLKFEPQPLLATAIVEPPRVSGIRRAVGSIPGLGFLKRKRNKNSESFQPARAVRQVRPISPGALDEPVPVRVRLAVSDKGEVVDTEVLTKRVRPELAQMAREAARQWRFEPARVDQTPVETEVVVQFRFAPIGSKL